MVRNNKTNGFTEQENQSTKQTRSQSETLCGISGGFQGCDVQIDKLLHRDLATLGHVGTTTGITQRQSLTYVRLGHDISQPVGGTAAPTLGG